MISKRPKCYRLITQTIGHLQKEWVLCWGQVCTPQMKGKMRAFGCVLAKPLICIRLRGCTPTTREWPWQTDLCFATGWVLRQIWEKANKQILQGGITLLKVQILSPLHLEEVSCKPEDTHLFWEGTAGSTKQGQRAVMSLERAINHQRPPRLISVSFHQCCIRQCKTLLAAEVLGCSQENLNVY